MKKIIGTIIIMLFCIMALTIQNNFNSITLNFSANTAMAETAQLKIQPGNLMFSQAADTIDDSRAALNIVNYRAASHRALRHFSKPLQASTPTLTALLLLPHIKAGNTLPLLG